MMGSVEASSKVRCDVRGVAVPFAGNKKGIVGGSDQQSQTTPLRLHERRSAVTRGKIDQSQKCRGMALPRRITSRAIHRVHAWPLLPSAGGGLSRGMSTCEPRRRGE